MQDKSFVIHSKEIFIQKKKKLDSFKEIMHSIENWQEN